jgi:hypothetical protein
MQAAIDFAKADLKLAKQETAGVSLEIRLGTFSVWKDEAQEIVALLEEKTS